MKQIFENMPAKIAESRRFFLVAEDKRPLQKDWSKREFQKSYNEIEGLAGFDTCGHNTGGDTADWRPDYLFLDFDHVLNNSGEFVNSKVAEWVKKIQLAFPGVYIEKSISGTGLHIFMEPTAGKSPQISNSKAGVLHFDENRDKNAPKLEIFYGSGGRYCLVTGALFECEKGSIIPSGVAVDEFLESLLAEIQKQLAARSPGNPALEGQTSVFFANEHSTVASRLSTITDWENEPLEYVQALGRECLNYIDPAGLEPDNWLAVNTACKGLGLDYYSDVDAWNRRDLSRYNEKENKARWDSLTPSQNFGIETLIGMARQFGFSPKEFWHQWHKDTPQYNRGDTQKPFDPDAPLSFITNEGDRADFVKLASTTPSKTSRAAMIKIIRRYLDKKRERRGETRIKPTAANFRKIFNTDPVLDGLFGFEEFKEEIVFLKQPPWRKGDCTQRVWSDSDDAALRNYLRENYIEDFKDLVVADMFNEIALLNGFNVAKLFFERLPVWDKKPRAEKLFIDFLNIDNTEYARKVSLTWLLAAVARIYYPGCKFQNALVLQGEQGVGKSYLLEQLAGEFYGTLISNVDDTHALDEIRSMFICEIKEMSAMRKADVNAQKAFLERSADSYRPAYARRAQKFQRHCVFAITVNDNEFLRDGTGNRRYWILKSNSAQFEIKQGLTREYIRQIWAEVLFRFKELTVGGFNPSILDLPLELKQQSEEITAQHVVDDGLKGEIREFLDIPIPAPVIWKLLTKEEKRKFFEHNSITLEYEDLEMRSKSLTEKEKEIFHAFFDEEDEDKHFRNIEKRVGDRILFEVSISGSTQRTETCAAEIHNEFFAIGDKRKTVNKIAEILARLEGWVSLGQQRKKFGSYGNQKKIYCRVSNNENTENGDDLPF